ncbi:MAG: thiamine biosynthesis protein ThiS [Chloroflexi bacterium HGW-Chloroflexi-10]|nr:MAG: thiamine biosynthesis protein ThiS [Chloroflexi bacterium HGW-Chloroflexi-10]
MSVTIIIRKKTFEIENTQDLNVRKAMDSVNILPEAYLAVRNGEILTEREILRDGDIVKFIPVISGG